MKSLQFFSIILVLLLLLLCSCQSKKKSNTKAKVQEQEKRIDQSIAKQTIEYPKTQIIKKDLSNTLNVETLKDNIDLNMDISNLSLSDIRLLRNSFAARQGYCFMKADLRGVFGSTSWYSQRMEDRFWAEESGDSIPPISYSDAEMSFIKRLREREEELMSRNFLIEGERIKPNIENIINLFQLENSDPKLMDKLAENGFAIVPNSNIQLFHVYEKNDYQQFPSFVTTDMYMQLFHMYFSYVLRTIEEDQFIPLLSDICLEMLEEMQTIANNNNEQSIIDAANFNATYYAVAYSVLNDTTINVPEAYGLMYQDEIKHINEAQDEFSEFLDYEDYFFPYSLFKVRGHYTRNENLKRYFKAMMWLQTAPFCLDNDFQLQCSLMSAFVLNNNALTLKKYRSIMEPVSFIIGQPDNISFLDLAQKLEQNDYSLKDLLLNKSTLKAYKQDLGEIVKGKNKISPKESLTCVDKINFIPQRYLADNKVLQELVDVESEVSKRAFPKGLDVMAAFGSKTAENILFAEEKWELYPEKLAQLQVEMRGVDGDKTVYNKWIKSLLELQKSNDKYPYFMQTQQWDKKNLMASLASWAELKHDAILYAEQPMAAECGGGGPPEPITVGYVEPNVAYWNAALELLALTKNVFIKNNIWNDAIAGVTSQLEENAQFLLAASEKELNGISLSEKEYQQIEYIGSSFEWMTLDLIRQKDQYLDGWHNVQGPDKSVAVVADIYTANASNNPNKGILHVATGNVNDIYVVVEIEGYLYLTKGAVLSYHEFSKGLGTRLTDEEWQSLLDSGNVPDMPNWMKEIMTPIIPPKSNQKIFYSSGC
ncbi:DUF3160 domain-containing protein [Saccharicrinis fermentans]|uniref:YARHG domain-containing protein n=1 Tax=Saccharicrinis fermentans DSM 9555 = JCM 21142 TaxID=869213 RepID=W7YAR3_9BACT|nr:DUF3160 domain-containing protein [Saccharicrinis fermentans]GAF05472.1 hypothetical protein JCM21142_104207 [Saccharicrinis fermentans DSM 9555 = JCM 21142]